MHYASQVQRRSHANYRDLGLHPPTPTRVTDGRQRANCGSVTQRTVSRIRQDCATHWIGECSCMSSSWTAAWSVGRAESGAVGAEEGGRVDE